MQWSLISHIFGINSSKTNFLTPNDNQPNIRARDSYFGIHIFWCAEADTGAALGGGASFRGITFGFGSDSELFLSDLELPSVQASWIIQTPNKNTLTQNSKVELGI